MERFVFCTLLVVAVLACSKTESGPSAVVDPPPAVKAPAIVFVDWAGGSNLESDLYIYVNGGIFEIVFREFQTRDTFSVFVGDSLSAEFVRNNIPRRVDTIAVDSITWRIR